jgi:hypothetical protein
MRSPGSGVLSCQLGDLLLQGGLRDRRLAERLTGLQGGGDEENC